MVFRRSFTTGVPVNTQSISNCVQQPLYFTFRLHRVAYAQICYLCKHTKVRFLSCAVLYRYNDIFPTYITHMLSPVQIQNLCYVMQCHISFLAFCFYIISCLLQTCITFRMQMTIRKFLKHLHHLLHYPPITCEAITYRCPITTQWQENYISQLK